mmetsp:Transcript_29362/g.84072  ORF Transcript_29362/g.84072 Transcript_29362/m.84072 type:complete len:156 (-) Transcript_29362:93-560(-)
MAAWKVAIALAVLGLSTADESLAPALDADAECSAGEGGCALNALQHRAEKADGVEGHSVRCYCHGCAAGSACRDKIASCSTKGDNLFVYTKPSRWYTSMRASLWRMVTGKDDTYPCQMTCRDQGFEQYCDFAANKLCWTVADKHGTAVPASIAMC